MRILIIRHGDPNYEKDCLTEKGKREATLLAEKLKKETIDYFYTSPLGRAKETCETVARAMGRENEIIVKDWLQEFNHAVVLPSGRERDIPWDMYPEEWINNGKMYDKDAWLEQDFYRAADMERYYKAVVDGLDELIATHGYIRKGNGYCVKKRNRETVALFCHFGLEAVLLSRLCNISPVPIWHHFVALTSSITTLYTEERIENQAVFRCCGFGDIGHLYAGGEQPSFSARFCETFDSDERH